jgi:hypothetical protein
MSQEKPENINTVKVSYDRSLDELVALMRASEPNCWAAYPALAHLGTPDSLVILQQALNSEDWRHRRAATEWIVVHKLSIKASDDVIRLLNDSSPFVVRQACQSAAKMRLESARPYVIALLTNAVPETRWAAAYSLEFLGNETDAEKLIEVFDKDDDEEVRKAATWSLRKIVSGRTRNRIFKLFKEGGLPRYKIWACEIADKFGLSDFPEIELRAFLNDKDGHVRKAAKLVLQKRKLI